jgi:hypothetical protein
LLQTLSESLARTRDAQQFQVQAEVALLAACDVESSGAPPIAAHGSIAAAPSNAVPQTIATAAAGAAPNAAPLQPAARQPDGSVPPIAAEPAPVATGASLSVTPAAAGAPPIAVELQPAAADAPPIAAEPPIVAGRQASREAVPATAADEPAPAAASDGAAAPSQEALKSRWPDVVDHVRSRKPILGALLSSARPVSTDGAVLTVAFETEFNKKRAEIGANRQAIEAGIEHALGRAYRLRCTVNGAGDGQPSLLEDPVINYAARTFGGQPRRVASDPGEPAEPPL